MLSRRERKPNRLRGFDYSHEGFYFVTLCTKDRHEYFGACTNGMMLLNGVGRLAAKFWQEIPGHYKNAFIDEFVVMPDHIHGIIMIKGDTDTPRLTGTQSRARPCSTGLISRIVKSSKEAVTKAVVREFPFSPFGWQRSFYDHVVRKEESLLQLRKYIRDNPDRWALEKGNSEADPFPTI